MSELTQLTVVVPCSFVLMVTTHTHCIIEDFLAFRHHSGSHCEAVN